MPRRFPAPVLRPRGIVMLFSAPSLRAIGGRAATDHNKGDDAMGYRGSVYLTATIALVVELGLYEVIWLVAR